LWSNSSDRDSGAPYVSGAPVSTPFVLSGDIHNVSTEAGWLGLLANVSGVIRLYD